MKFGSWHAAVVQQGQGNTTARTNRLKKANNGPVFANLRVQEKEKAGEKWYGLKTKKKNQECRLTPCLHS